MGVVDVLELASVLVSAESGARLDVCFSDKLLRSLRADVVEYDGGSRLSILI